MTPEQLQVINEALDSEHQYWSTIASDPEEECKAQVAKIADARAALVVSSEYAIDMEKRTTALYDAVSWVLGRVQTDPEFRWHMLGTESLDRLIRAEAAYTGHAEHEIRAERERDKQPPYRKRRCECMLNRDRVSTLESLLEEHGIEYPAREH